MLWMIFQIRIQLEKYKIWVDSHEPQGHAHINI